MYLLVAIGSGGVSPTLVVQITLQRITVSWAPTKIGVPCSRGVSFLILA